MDIRSRATTSGSNGTTVRARMVGLRRLLPASFHGLDYSTQRRWMLLLSLSGTLLVLTGVGALTGAFTGALSSWKIPFVVLVLGGYGLSVWLPYRVHSHVLPSHVFLATMLMSLAVITVAIQRPWLFAPLLGTLVPIMAVQLLGRTAAIVWTLVAVGLLAATIIAALTGVWFTQPQTLMGNEVLDHAFLSVSMPVLLLVLVWFHETSRSHVETASSFKSAVLAGMSHELRTPLNGVLGMLEEVLGGPLEPEQRERVVLAHRAGDSLLSIVDDALDLLQAESGGLLLGHASFDLHEELVALEARHVERSQRPDVKISLHYSDAAPRWFIGDGPKVLRVVDKLVDNALKFTDRGHVRVHVDVASATEDEASTVTVRVEDTGIGIPKEKHTTIFDKLTQIEDSWDRTRGGIGMGLAVCRELVDLMGGEIGIESELGRGTTLSFSIPMAVAPKPAAEVEAAPEPIPDPLRSATRTLVVEDNSINQKVAKRMLERLGCEVEIASDGREAVDRVREAEYDIVFMDIQMPVMDGFQATAAIREASDEVVASLPVVAMTAFTMAGDRERCLDAGMDGYVGKPINRERLVAELRRLTPSASASSARGPLVAES